MKNLSNTLYFEGDSVSFGEEGKFYKWFIPFPLENWSFEEVTRDEYERAIGAGLTCVPFDPPRQPENTTNKVLRTYPPDHVRNFCCSSELRAIDVPCGTILSNVPSRNQINL